MLHSVSKHVGTNATTDWYLTANCWVDVTSKECLNNDFLPDFIRCTEPSDEIIVNGDFERARGTKQWPCMKRHASRSTRTFVAMSQYRTKFPIWYSVRNPKNSDRNKLTLNCSECAVRESTASCRGRLWVQFSICACLWRSLCNEFSCSVASHVGGGVQAQGCELAVSSG